MSDGVDIDLYPEELDNELEGAYEPDENDEEIEDDNDNVGEDLYDDVIDVSKLTDDGRSRSADVSQLNDDDGQGDRHEEEIVESSTRQSKEMRMETTSTPVVTSGKKVALYCGNLTWWTSDADLEEAIRNFGVLDLLSIKFSENRANGQSKGYCIIEVGSTISAQKIMDHLVKTELHGNRPVVNYHKGGSQHESGGGKKSSGHSNQGGGGGSNSKNKSGSQLNQQSNVHRNTSRGVNRGNPPSNQHRFPHQPSNIRPPSLGPRPHNQPTPMNIPPPASAPVRNVMQPPVPMNSSSMGGNIPRIPNMRGPPPDWQQPQQQQQPQPHMMQNPQHQHTMQMPNQQHQQSNFMQLGSNVVTPGMHVNPAFLPSQENFMPKQTPMPQPSPRMEAPQAVNPLNRPTNDIVYNEVIQRNQEAAQKAITSALADSNAGDHNNAIETLVTAISLIKTSVLANDDRSKTLLDMLQGCLKSVEAKMVEPSSRKHRRERDSDRDREHRDRSPDRDLNDPADRHDDRRSRHRHHREGRHERDHRSERERIRSNKTDRRR